jgi:small subunit ribosomal protein S20
MPQHKQAIKRVRQNKKRREHNRKQRSRMKTLVSNVMEETEREKAEEKFTDAVSYLDKMSTKGKIHPNNAARKKSKLAKHVNNL